MLVYFTPRGVSQLFFLPLLVMAYRSKRNYIWLAFLFILIDNPGFLFYGGQRESFGRAPIYTLIAGISFTFQDLLIVTFILKSVLKSAIKPYVAYASNYKYLTFAIVLSILVSFIYGISNNSIQFFLRTILYLSLLFFLPRLMTKNEWVKLAVILYPIVVFTLIDQLYSYFNGNSIISIINPEVLYKYSFKVVKDTQEASRLLTAPIILLFVLFSALTISLSKVSNKSKNLIHYLIASVCYLQIILSATRGWFISFSFFILFFLFWVNKERSIKSAFSIILVFSIIILIVQNNPTAYKQLMNSIERFSSLFALAQGDVTAQQTLMRIDVRTPLLINRIIESAFLGYGFSTIGQIYIDEHVGYISPIVHFGVIGYLLILVFYYKYIKKLYDIYINNNIDSHVKNEIKSCILILISIVIIHVTSRQVIGFNIVTSYNLVIPLFFSFTNSFVSDIVHTKYKK